MRTRRPRGFTLMELAVGIAVISVILVAVGSVMVVASKALPAAPGPGENSVSANAAMERLSSEIRYATAITEASATAVEFRVADRDADAQEETIRYAWSGTPGAPLTREYNHGGAVAALPSLTAFALGYDRHTHSTTTNTTTTWDSGEVLLSAFSSWSGIIATQSTTNLTSTTWAAERFTIDRVSLPADLTKLSITRVSLKLKKPTSGTIGATVGIYLPSSSGASTPATSVIGTPDAIPDAELSTSWAWADAQFSDVSFNNKSNIDFVLVVKGVAATTSASIQYLNSLTAPLDSAVYRYTTTSGGSWLPTLSLNTSDAPFSVYGSYQRQVQTTANVDTYTLGSVSITLQPSSAAATRVLTAVETPNEPAIPGP